MVVEMVIVPVDDVVVVVGLVDAAADRAAAAHDSRSDPQPASTKDQEKDADSSHPATKVIPLMEDHEPAAVVLDAADPADPDAVDDVPQQADSDKNHYSTNRDTTTTAHQVPAKAAYPDEPSRSQTQQSMTIAMFGEYLIPLLLLQQR